MTTPDLTLPFAGADTDAHPWSRLFRRLTALPGLLSEHIRRVSTERWWLLLFAALFLGFFVALLFQPGIGRGGR